MRALRELVAKKYDAFTRRKGGAHRKLDILAPARDATSRERHRAIVRRRRCPLEGESVKRQSRRELGRERLLERDAIGRQIER